MPEPVSTALLQYGVLGVVAIVLFIFAKTAYKRETDRGDRMEAEVLRLNQLIQERHIPALMKSTEAVEAAMNVLRHMQDRR